MEPDHAGEPRSDRFKPNWNRIKLAELLMAYSKALMEDAENDSAAVDQGK